jgi:predicted negative regulator of RcsB-dependent stress response
MLRENGTALLLLYIRPVAAISRILDHGRLWFAILAALGVGLLQRHGVAHGILEDAVLSWIGFSLLAPLATIVLVFVPVVIFLRAAAGFGSFPVLMRSDYSSLLLCVLMAWAAAYLPVVVVGFVFSGGILMIAANLYFAVLAAFGIRTLFGIGFGPAIGLSLLGCIAAMGAIALSDFAGPLKYYLMSPFLLYYGYSMFGGEVRSLGEGLRGRQQFQRQLELSTSNPRDSDAHYQLGLVYQKRRQYSDAIARFQKAVEIDPAESDAQFQLGRIAREQGRFDDAIGFLKAAAALDDKLSSSEVWRELGAAYFEASRLDEAAAALKKYTDRRSYDPEGLYWYGKTLAALGRAAEAHEAFAQCIEAVDTMPRHRRAQVRKWKGLAKTELRAVTV